MGRRLGFFGLVAMVILLVAGASLSRMVSQRSPWELARFPGRAAGPEELATRAVPGWGRAREAGLIVPLGISERVPGTETPVVITLEQAWYSAREIYVLYTVKADDGKYIMPTWAFLGLDGSKAAFSQGRTDWTNLQQWGAFSEAGFHGVLAFSRFTYPPPGERLNLTVRQWGRVSPQQGLDPSSSPAGQLTLSIPWRAEWLKEPEPRSSG